jgi:hypothetical protein
MTLFKLVFIAAPSCCGYSIASDSCFPDADHDNHAPANRNNDVSCQAPDTGTEVTAHQVELVAVGFAWKLAAAIDPGTDARRALAPLILQGPRIHTLAYCLAPERAAKSK